MNKVLELTNGIVQDSLDGLLDPVLRDNGGPTQTHALIYGSAAINTGDNTAATDAGLATDQRGTGFSRIVDETVDIGAYEAADIHFLVDTTADIDDGDYSTGNLSLREAIRLANESPTADTITFAAALAGQSIVLANELLISDDLTITGLGADQLTLDGDGNSRIFDIDDSLAETKIAVKMSGLALVNGSADDGGAILNYENLTVIDCVFSGNDASNSQFFDDTTYRGGAIHNAGGSLTVDGTLLNENSANYGAGIYSIYGTVTVTNSTFKTNSVATSLGDGGGIYICNGNLTVSHSAFEDNSAEQGAGVYFNGGDIPGGPIPSLEMNISDSTFTRNTGEDGGGIYFESPYQSDDHVATLANCSFSENVISGNGAGVLFQKGQASVSGSTFSGNISDRLGGGISNIWTTLTIDNSTFDNNSARLYGGGISNGGFFDFEGGGDVTIRNSTISENSSTNSGGGFYTSLGAVVVANSTFSGNHAVTSGGAIYTRNFEGPESLEIFSSTLVGNTARVSGGIYTHYPVVVINSILAGNPSEDPRPQNYGSISVTHSIIQDSIDGLLDPMLRDNGGSTKTHALLLGSAAIDAGDNTAVSDAELNYDQRGAGFDRISGGTVDIGSYEVQVDHVQLDVRIVDSPTPTEANGGVSSLPQSRDWIDEWSSYWVEIWVRLPSTADQGILSVAFDLSYNTNVTSATSIEFGAAFAVNQTGVIDDQNSMIDNLSAGTSLDDVGVGQHALFARIRFESTVDDGIDLDLEGQSLAPQSPLFPIADLDVLISNGTTIEDLQRLESQTQIWANSFDLNDDDTIDFRDLIRFVTVYNQTPSQSASADAWFADFNQDDRVDFRDLILFASNYGRRKSGSVPVNYPDNYPDAWNQLLMVAATEPPQKPASSVTQSTVETVLEATVAEFSPQLSAEQQATLSQVDIEVVDLAEGTLGRAAGGTIYIDVNASGYGWFVDATPDENSEFSGGGDLTLIALPDSDAAGLIDLRTVILHELGHLLGFEHTADGLMQETLAPGVRYLSDWESDTDEFFGSLTDATELTVF
ncbi:choice-of-anchor Q domain-containing protein [Gimesia panareensis]|uniref:choice-of-anchor Q domain-containing protein n=1 Tax=Gimesia panareensis TaxID=2527978 RepID=UPI0018D61C72|nr:choice-of-anchor Q domain-containing protein [Gimesia panareensis]